MSSVVDSAISSGQRPEEIKRFTVSGEHSFIVDGRFEIDKYQFPLLTKEMSKLNSAEFDLANSNLDANTTIRSFADVIGSTIQNVYHQVPPNGVLKEIAKRFHKDNSIMADNIAKLFKENLVKFARLEVSYSLFILIVFLFFLIIFSTLIFRIAF